MRSVTFTYDSGAPTVVLQAPANGIYFSSVTALTISGTASETPSGVQAVQVNIQNGGNYWSGTDNGSGSFGASLNYVTATFSNPGWTFTIPAAQLAANFVSGQSYSFQARAWSVAGTTSSFTSANTITYDIEAPTGTVVSPGAYMNNTQTQIAGTAYDGASGVAKVEVALSSDIAGGNGTWYNGTSFTVNLSSNTVWQSTSSWSNLGGGEISWAWNRPALTQGDNYSILLRVTDAAGNVKTYPLSARSNFFYDQNPPAVTIQAPNANFINSLPILSGQSTDAAVTLTGVQVAISTGGAAFTNFFWNGTTWQAGPTPYWFNAPATDGSFNSGSEPWNLTGASTPTWANGVTYKVQAQSTDEAALASSIVSTTFTYDNVPASAGITQPPSLAAYNALTLVSGTMSDSPNPSPLTVQIALRHPANTFWDGSGFNAYNSVTSWVSATQIFSSSWTFTNLPTVWDDRTLYRLYVRAIDLAGNPVTDPDFLNAGLQFRIDFSSPVSHVTSLLTTATNYLSAPLITITGTANDLAGGSGISTVNIRVQRSDGLYLNASENGFNGGSSNFPLPTSNGTTWSKTFADPVNTFVNGYGYQFQSRSADNSSPTNVEQIYTTAFAIVDQSTPTSTVTSGTSGYFNNSVTALQGTMADALVPPGNLAAGVSTVTVEIFDGSALSNPWWDGATWVSGATPLNATVFTSSWTLPNTPTDWSHGTNADGRWFQFYVQSIDRAGNTEAFHVITSTYDIQPGTASISVPNTGVVSSLPSITGTATDTTYGATSIGNVEISIQRNSDSEWYRFSNQTWNPSVPNIWNSVDSYNPGNGVWSIATTQGNIWNNLDTYNIYTRAIDKAGNVQTAQVYPSTFTFIFEPPPSVVVITKPVNNKFYKENLSDILGTANAATTLVEIQVERLSDPVNRYWNGTLGIWVSSSVYNVANQLAANWAWNSGNPASGDWFIYGSSYIVRAFSMNSANISGTQVTANFGFDNQTPASQINKPLTGFTSSLTLITGTASDQLGEAGVNNVKIDIQRVTNPDTSGSDNLYWNGSSWVGGRPKLNTGISFGAPNLWNWNYTVAVATAFTDGYAYQIFSKAQDEAFDNINVFDGNLESDHSITVVYDISIPTATITSVVNNSVRSSVAIASGDVSDLLNAGLDANAPGLGQVQQVQLSIRRNSNGSYWSGVDWQPGPTPIYLPTALYVSSWTYTSLPDFTQPIYNRESFDFRVTALDKAGNLNALFVAGISDVGFTVDNQAPTVSISLPGTNAVRSQLSAISGSVDDNTSTDYPNNSGVNSSANVDTLVYYTQSGATYYWTGTSFSSTTTQGASWKSVDIFNVSGPSSGTWTYSSLGNLRIDPPVYGWKSDIAYTIMARARDNALPTPNLGSNAISFNVIIDTTPPVSAVTAPNTSPIRSLSIISATANADLGGFGNVKFSIRDQNNNYFNGAAFSAASEVFLDTRSLSGLTGTQVYTSTFVTSANLVSGSTYTVRIFATDSALPTPNTQVGGTPGTYSFLFDNVPPETLTIGQPAVNGAYGPNQTLPTITGQAVDNHSGLAKIELEIEDSDNLYWGGSAFDQASSSWVAVSGSLANWSYNSPAWIVNKDYTVRARATDRANNVSTTTLVTFTYDSTAPVVSAMAVPFQAYQAAGTVSVLSGTAQDGLANPYSGLLSIEIAIKDEDDSDANKWYSGVNATGFNQASALWRPTSSTITASASAPWSYPFASDEIPNWQAGHSYAVNVRATDAALNVSAVAISSFVYDATPPSGTITAPPTGAPSYQRSVPIISGTAADTTGVSAPRAGSVSDVQIRIRHVNGSIWWNPTEAGGANWDASITTTTAWFDVVTTNSWANWYFSSAVPSWASGITYAVSMRAYDAAGNVSSIVYSTFTYDTNLPQSAVTFPANTTLINSLGGIGIQGTASDAGSPVLGVLVAIRRLSDGLWWNGVNGDFTDPSAMPLFQPGVTGTSIWAYPISSLSDSILLSGSSYYITSQATDSAGNVQTDFQTGSSTFSFDKTPPQTGITQPMANAVFFGGEAYYSSLATISGTADDYTMLPLTHNLNAGVGPTGVKTSILDRDTSFYWKQGTVDFSETDDASSWFSAAFSGTSSGTWAYSPAGYNAALTSGHTYVVRSSGTDLISNIQVNISSQVFVFDSSAPVAVISVPATGVSRNSLTQITGTARDYPITMKRVGMAQVALQIVDLGDDQTVGGAGSNADTYWDGVSTFTTTSSTITINISGQGQVTWSYDNPDGIWQDGHTYLLRATASDALGNAAPAVTSQFVFDSSAPFSNVMRPAEGIGYNGSTNQLITLSANVQDLPGSPHVNVGVNSAQVFFSLRRDDNNNNVSDAGDLYWDGNYPGSFNQASEVIARLHSDGGVAYSTAAPTWDSGYRYFMDTWSVDNLGNTESRRTRRFTVDVIPPDSAITVPSDGASSKGLVVVSGTAADATSGIAAVYLTVWDLGPDFTPNTADDLYWNSGSGWGGSPSQVTANLVSVYTTSATWNVTTAGNGLPSTWTSGRIYRLISQAQDSAANLQTVVSTITFQIDNIPPFAVILQPANNSGFTALNTLSGTAGGTEVSGNRDFSNIASIQLQVIDISAAPNTYWNGAIFTTSVANAHRHVRRRFFRNVVVL